MCDKIICISDGNYNTLSLFRFIPLSKLHKVYNYTSITSPRTCTDSIVYTSEVAIIGRLQNQHKGQYDFIINNYLYLVRMNIRVHLFGEGPDYKLLSKLIASSSCKSNIILHGFVDTARIYTEHSFSTVICYSYWEGLPLNLLESYGAGKIVLGRDIPGVNEIIFPLFRFSSDSQLQDIMNSLDCLFARRTFRNEYSLFVGRILAKYNKYSSMVSLNELFDSLSH